MGSKKKEKKDKTKSRKKEKKSKKKKLSSKKEAKVETMVKVTKTTKEPKKSKKGSKNPADYDIPEQVLKILEREGIKELFPIQYQTFDVVYGGKDVIGKAYTGSGKTLAFVLPTISQLLQKGIKAKWGDGTSVICLTPTRELCMQVAKVFETYATGLTVTSVYGGSSYERQIRGLEKGTDIVVGTCGRVKDMIERGNLKLNRCQFVILDEADEMLSMGFEEEVELILANLNKSDFTVQTLLFSATIPRWVDSLCDKYLRAERQLVDLVKGKSQQSATTVTHMALCCHWQETEQVLADILLTKVKSNDRVMIFCDTKKSCNELVVSEWIKQECQALHGDVVQKQREITTDGFRKGRFPILVCTDVAARGLDINDVQLVVQIEPPKSAETYIHRSGRTGRAGKKGTSIMFYTPKKSYIVNTIERKMGSKFKRIGAPQRAELAAKCAEQSFDKIRDIPQNITDIFTPLTEKFLGDTDLDPKTVLANALALISGYTKESNSRSVLSCSTGFVTIQANTDIEARSTGFFFSQLEKHFGYNLRREVRGLCLLASKKGAVFDCPTRNVKEVLAFSRPFMSFEAVQELPELLITESGGGRGGFGGRGRGRGRGYGYSRGRGSGRGYSSRGGSRGRGRFSRGSRGRGRNIRFGGRRGGGRGRGVGKR